VSESRLRYLPLGGLGEVGINMWALEWENQVLVVDAGLMFPQDDMLGIDLVLPFECPHIDADLAKAA
jgi:ribonuclease J